MKKLMAVLFVVAMIFSFNTAMAQTGSTEGQAFQNLDVTYGQQAGIQQIQQQSVTYTTVTSQGITVDISGSLHANPDYLLFAKGGGEIYEKTVVNTTTANITANMNTMSSEATMAGNAGASAAATGLAGTTSSAGNSGTVVQGQLVPYAQGGGGLQLSTVSGYTNVTAKAGL